MYINVCIVVYLGVGTCVLGVILIWDELFLFNSMGEPWAIIV